MSSNEENSAANSVQDTNSHRREFMTITQTRDTELVPKVAFSRRSFLAGGAAVGAGLLLVQAY
jgi:hypothetical protein